MRVLVTGGAGFIGSNLVHALLSRGDAVLVVDDLSTGTMANIDPRSTFRHMDILDDRLGAVFEEFRPDGVVHLAAQASVVESLKDPARDREVNAIGTRAVALAAAASGASRVISASSAAVYGEPAELPLTETSPTVPINPYGASKLEAEGLLAAALDGTGVDHASFRFANVYGPRQDARGEGGVVAIFCDRIARGEAPIVFGDGSQTRDFIYVGDIVSAIVSALSFEGSLATERGASYNISTGTRTSVDELIMPLRLAARFMGAVEYQPAREGDILHSVLDPSKAQQVFGWSAGVPLESGLSATWRWFSSQ